MKQPSLNSFWCDHKDKRHEFKIIWKDRTEEVFTCMGCGKRLEEVIYNEPKRTKNNLSKENIHGKGNDSSISTTRTSSRVK